MQSLYTNFSKLFSYYTIGKVAENFILFIFLPLYTSYLSPKDFGILALMNLIINILTSAISTPINSGFVRFYYNKEFSEKNDILLFNLFIYLLLQIIFIAILYYLVTNLLCSILFHDSKLYPIVKLFTLVLIFNPVSSFLQIFLRLTEQAKFYLFVSLSKVFLYGILTLILLIKLNFGVFAIIYGQIFGLGYMSIVMLPTFFRYSKCHLSIDIIKKPLLYGYPMIFTGFSNLLIQSGDRYVLNIFHNMSIVGIYDFGYKISSVINTFIIEPVKQGIVPIIFKNENKPETQKNFITQVSIYYYIIAIFLTLFLSLFSKEIFVFLAKNQEFWRSSIIVPIICFSFVLHGLGNFFGIGLSMAQKPYHISGILLSSALLNIILNFLLVPKFEIMGAALSTLISYFCWNALRLFYSAKYYQLYFDLKKLSNISIIAISLLSISYLSFDSINIKVTAFKLIIFALYPIAILYLVLAKEERNIIVKYLKSILLSIRSKF